MKAKNILDAKGRKIFSINEHTTVAEAVSEIVELNIGLVIVRDDEGALVGVLSERDVIKKCVLFNLDQHTLLVKDIMTARPEIFVADEEDDLQDLMNTMTGNRIRHLPIFKNGELSGMISIGDILKNLLDAKDHTIKTLSDYISGSYPG